MLKKQTKRQLVAISFPMELGGLFEISQTDLFFMKSKMNRRNYTAQGKNCINRVKTILALFNHLKLHHQNENKLQSASSNCATKQSSEATLKEACSIRAP